MSFTEQVLPKYVACIIVMHLYDTPRVMGCAIKFM